MAASKNRLLWHELPATARERIEGLVGAPVVDARNCPGGFSPGLASRLALGDGRRVFVKAIDADAWPMEAVFHRSEAAVAAALPATVPAPRFLGVLDDGHWTALAFEHVDGTEPGQPWNRADLGRVVATAVQLAQAVTPSPVALPRDQPRLGGWAALARDRSCLGRLSCHFPWAADNLGRLIGLEEDGLAAAQGPSLVHFDLHPHNILLTRERVLFVDWPHARLGSPVVDLVMLLSSVAADGIDPEPVLHDPALRAAFDLSILDVVLAAHTGFLLRGGLSPVPAGLEPIAEAKLRLGRGGVDWLRRRIAHRA